MKFEINVYQRFDPESRRVIQAIAQSLETIMKTLDDVLEEVAKEKAGIDSLKALVSGLRTQVSEVLSGVKLPEGVQAKVDKIFANVETNVDTVNTLLNETPVAGTNQPDPVPPTA